MSLANIRIFSKVMIVIFFTGTISLVISFVGFWGLEKLSSASSDIDSTSSEIKYGTRLGQNVLELNRAEYRLAANPTEFEDVLKSIEITKKEFSERLRLAESTAGQQQATLINEIKNAYSEYLKELEKTSLVAKENYKNVQISENQRDILNSVVSSRVKAQGLRERVKAYVDFTDEKGTQISTVASQTAKNVEIILITTAFIGIFIGLLVGYLISTKGITKPLKSCVNALSELAKGNLDVEVVGDDRKDEIGDIARTMEVFRDNALERVKSLEREKIELLKREERANEMQHLTETFDLNVSEMMKALTTSADTLQSTAENMATIAEQTERQSTIVAAASEEASSNVETVAASTEELSASISEITQQVTQSSDVANGAVKEGKSTNEQVEKLENAAHRIGEVINLISGIADQTNMLALNATIEAARAGEAGKGFAVVASEVKNLANQTAKATHEISEQITNIQEETRFAATAIDRIVQTIQNMSDISSSIAAAAEQQTAATNEIARNVEEASKGTREVASNIVGVSEASQQTGLAADQVLNAANTLSEQADKMQNTVLEFIHKVRSL